jgi:hypothetical protein
VKPNLQAKFDSEDVVQFVDGGLGVDGAPYEREGVYAVHDGGGAVQVEGSPGVESLPES